MKIYKHISSNKLNTEIHVKLVNELRDEFLDEIFCEIKNKLYDGIFKELYLKISNNLNIRQETL